LPDEQEPTGGGHRARVAGLRLFVLPFDFAGRHVVRGDVAGRFEPGGDDRVGADVGLALLELRFLRRHDQAERAGLRADEVHVLFRVIRGRRPVVATDRRVGDQVDHVRVRAVRGERFAADDLRFRIERCSSFFGLFDRLGLRFHRAERFHGRLGLSRPGVLLRILRDLHLGDRVDRFAVLLADQVDPTGLLRLAHRFDLFAVHFAFEEDGRRRRVVVPEVVVDLLEVAVVFAGFGVEADDRGGEEVFTLTVFAGPRCRVRGGEEQQPGLRVHGRRIPDRGAAGFVGAAVLGPGVATEFARRRGGPEAPFLFAGFGVEGGQTPADAVLAARTTDVDLVVVVERGARDREAFTGLDHVGAPFDFAGRLIQRHLGAVQLRDEDHAVADRDAAVVPTAADDFAERIGGKVRFVGPEPVAV